MSSGEMIVVTTHVDRHNERFAMSALEGMVDQANSSYIPMGVEHDPRFPPMGRITHAEISPLPDGEYAVKATFELFDVDTVRSDARRSIPLDVREIERFDVAYDRTSRANDARGDIAALAGLAGSEPREMGKKSVEPLAELVLQFGVFVVGSIALGMFTKVGEDAWAAIKSRLVQRYEEPPGRELLVTAVGLQGSSRQIEVLVILSEPTAAEVAAYFDYGYREADGLVDYALSREADVAKVVLVWDGDSMKLAYAVRWDAVPVLVDEELIPPLPEEWRQRD